MAAGVQSHPAAGYERLIFEFDPADPDYGFELQALTREPDEQERALGLDKVCAVFGGWSCHGCVVGWGQPARDTITVRLTPAGAQALGVDEEFDIVLDDVDDLTELYQRGLSMLRRTGELA